MGAHTTCCTYLRQPDTPFKQLLDLNLEVARRIERGEPVTAPGIPPNYPTPRDLITDDCIRP